MKKNKLEKFNYSKVNLNNIKGAGFLFDKTELIKEATDYVRDCIFNKDKIIVWIFPEDEPWRRIVSWVN